MTVPVYRPFIDDPNDIARFEGQRFVVLRPSPAVSAVHHQVQSLIKERFASADASYPAQAHVTLAGFAKGTPLEAVLEVVAEWAPSVPPVRLEVEKASYFPAPFQIVIVQIRKTPALDSALASLRARAIQRGLADAGMVPVADWIFHMSVAYCPSLSSVGWTAMTQFIDGLSVEAAECVVAEVEIVAFDRSQEYSGGIFGLSDGTDPRGASR